MFYRNSYRGIDHYAAHLIRYKARQLVGKGGWTDDDRPDLEQELMIDLLRRMEHFDPHKSHKHTFMTRIVERRVATLLAARYARCRDWRQCTTSLNAPIPDSADEVTELVEQLGSEGQWVDHEHVAQAQREQDMRLDMARTIAALPEPLRQLCIQLQSHNMAEIARHMGVPRSTLYRQLTQLREALRAAGLEEYL